MGGTNRAGASYRQSPREVSETNVSVGLNRQGALAKLQSTQPPGHGHWPVGAQGQESSSGDCWCDGFDCAGAAQCRQWHWGTSSSVASLFPDCGSVDDNTRAGPPVAITG